MARKITKGATSDPSRTSLTVGKDHFRRQLQERIDEGNQLLKNSQSNGMLKSTYNSWDDYNSELLKVSFDNPNNEYRDRYVRCNDRIIYSRPSSPAEGLNRLNSDFRKKIEVLTQLQAKIDLIPSLMNEEIRNQTAEDIVAKLDDKIFIVHGHDNELKVEVARLLEKLSLTPVILSEQPNEGATIIEKFEKHSEVGFAIVLLTGDDQAMPKGSTESMSRARQNVILELGYFIGKIGRKRVVPLYSQGVEVPSDLHGIVYTLIDEGGAWKYKLSKELKAAGYSIDMNIL